MPLLFSLGQHRALMSVAAELRRGEYIFAFLDDQRSQTEWWTSTTRWPPICGTRRGSHCTKARQPSGTRVGSVLEVAMLWRRLPGRADPTAVVWRGNVHLEPHIQGLVVLGVPVGPSRVHVGKVGGQIPATQCPPRPDHIRG